MYFHIHAIWTHIWEGRLVKSYRSRGRGVMRQSEHGCTSSDKGTDAIMEAPPFIPFWPSLSPESHPLDTLSKNLGAHVLLGSTFTQGQTIIPLYSFFLPSMAQPPSNGRALHFCEHPGASVQGEISRFVLFPISCSASLGYNSWPLLERH